MYAVIKTGGKQYRVSEGQTLKVEKIEAEPGTLVELDQVLMVADGAQVQVGTPYLAGAKVMANIQSQGRAPKVRIVKFRRRKHYMKVQGHRQSYTELRIATISLAAT